MNSPIELKLSSLFNLNHCLLVNSGTAALSSIFFSARSSKKSEVIMPVDIYPPLVMAAIQAGLTPVFADTDSNGNICEQNAIELLSDNTRFILIVHMAGIPAAIAELTTVIKDRKEILLIEDFAQSLGSLVNGNCRVNPRCDAAFLSFSSSKFMAIGTGGAVLSNHTDLMNRISIFVNNGYKKGNGFIEAGLPYSFPDCLLDLLYQKYLDLDSEIVSRIEYFRNLESILPKDFVPVGGSMNFVPHKFVCKINRSSFINRSEDSSVFNAYWHIGEPHYPHLIWNELFFEYSNKHELSLQMYPNFETFRRSYFAFRFSPNNSIEKLGEFFAKFDIYYAKDTDL